MNIQRRQRFDIRVSFSALLVLLVISVAVAARQADNEPELKGAGMRIIFLHHSTGELIWSGGVKQWFDNHNRESGTDYLIEETSFPKQSPYGWNNYPYDYWNIWVRHMGLEPYMDEPTLEILTAAYDVIIFKHCFPVSDVLCDTESPDIASDVKRLENYKLQYEALQGKMREFPETKFIVWTAAPRIENRSLKTRIVSFLKRRSVQHENAERARAFVDWVRNEWDEPGDNIFIWDYYELATDGGFFIKEEFAKSPGDSHPGEAFSQIIAPAFCRRIVDVIEGRGDQASLTGESGSDAP